MRIPGKRRLLLAAGSAATVGAVATLVSGVTFGLFSASDSPGSVNTFTAGTVAVGLNPSGTQVTCTITGMIPGDSSAGAPIGSKSDATCKYQVKYTGSANAILGVDVGVANGTNPLFATGSNQGLQLYLGDGTNSYLTSAADNTLAGGGSPAGTTYLPEGAAPTATALPVAGIGNLLVNTNAAQNATVNFALDYALPLSSGNTYNNATNNTVTVTLTFHAVQAGNQTLPADCAVGQVCSSNGTTFAWS